MRKLKDLLLGVLMVIVATAIDRSFTPTSEETMKKETPTWVWVVIFLVGLSILMPLASCSQGRPVTVPKPEPVVVISPTVHNNLDFLYFAIAERGGLEAWFCMLGFSDPKTGNLLIQGITPVWVDSANGSAIMGRPSGCPTPVTVGTVHFHPGTGYCDLSNIDINTAYRLPFPSVAIVCKEDDGKPQILVSLRKEIEERWRKIPWDTSSNRFSFTPIYRYKR